MKPVKRGIKVWVLGDSHNGYFHKFQIYTGKEGSGEKQLVQRVVKTSRRILTICSRVNSFCVTWPTTASSPVEPFKKIAEAFLQA